MTRVLLLRRRAGPTEEVYVLGALRPLVESGRIELEVVDTGHAGMHASLRLAPLLEGRHVIVSRYCPGPVLARIRAARRRLASLHYLVDDDMPAAADSPGLPADYRRRQQRATRREFAALSILADRLVVTSEHLRERFASPRTRMLDPTLAWDVRPPAHIDDDPFVVAFHGTTIHGADLAAIAPALAAVHDARAQVRIELVTSAHVPAVLRRCARCVRQPWMPWPRYRRFVSRSPRHVLAVPLLDTPFNRGKSHVKVLDAAGLAAAGVYSARAPYARVVEHGRNGLLIADDPDAWRDAILALVDDRARTRALAEGGQALARRIGAHAQATAFWEEALRLA